MEKRVKDKTDKEIQETKTHQIMNTVAWMCSYFRENPDRFIQVWLPSIKLRTFQKILLWAMAHNDAAYLIASRGLGKTYIIAMYGIYKCICYPGTHMVCVSHTFKQGKEIILKVTELFMPKSPLLRNEIESWSTGQNDCVIKFKNGSWMRVAVAGESSRGIRSTVVCIDEARLVDQKIVDTIIRPMNSAPREAGYLNKSEYENLKEVPQEFYLSSAYYCQSEMFEKVKAYTANMLTDNLNYFVCDLPYQLSIKEGILLKPTIENEMSEATFSDISFMMEREGLFYGSAEDALFDYKTLEKCRILSNCLFDLDYYRINNTKIPEKLKDEVRVLSVDVALLASKRHNNDASCLIIHQGLPTVSHYYLDNIIYIETQEGLTTEELGLLIMRCFYKYECDWIALDSNGVGMGIADYLMGGDRFDPLYGTTYGCLDCIDNPEMSDRCKIKGSPKVIYAIKANAKFNNELALSLRAGFQNGNINLLLNDNDIDSELSKIRGYKSLSEEQQTRMKLPYVQTSFLINELINLTHDTSNGLIKVKEKSGMRKDRYSSLGYGYYVIQELGKKLKPKNIEQDIKDMFLIRQARRKRDL